MPHIELSDEQVLSLLPTLSRDAKREAACLLLADLLAEPKKARDEDLRVLAAELGVVWREGRDRENRRRMLQALADAREPEKLIALALDEMREAQIRNRQRAVEALTQSNSLRFLVHEATRTSEAYAARADEAQKAGNLRLAQMVRREHEVAESAAAELREALAAAEEGADAVKRAIVEAEGLFRARTAEALALRTLLHGAQAHASAAAALRGWETDAGSAEWERALNRVAQRIRRLQEEARAAIGSDAQDQDA